MCRTGDDYSAIGRLWMAVKDMKGCPDYTKFKSWVAEQQQHEVEVAAAERNALENMDCLAKEKVRSTIIFLHRHRFRLGHHFCLL